LSIPHPNITFKTVEDFLQAGEMLIQKYPINAIEINTKADEKRVKSILDFTKKNNLILTFGSDFHKGEGDETHGAF